MSHNLKTALKFLILFLMGIGVLYLAFRGQDLTSIWLEIKKANYFWVFISAASVLIAHVLRALRWQMLYGSIKYSVSFWSSYHALMVGYLANLGLPRFGEIVRCSIIQKTEKVPMFASIGTVITERLFDVLALLISSLGLLMFQYEVVGSFLQNVIYLNISEKLNAINYAWLIALVTIALLILIFAIYLLRQRFSRKFLKIFVSLKQGFGSYKKLKRKGLFLVYTFGIWMLYVLSMYFCFSAISATSGLGVNAGLAAMVFSGFAMVAPVQGGIGVFHWMVTQSLVLYSISFKDGLAYATIIHSSQFLLTLLLGSISLFKVLINQRQ